MSTSKHRAEDYVRGLGDAGARDELAERIGPRKEPAARKIPGGSLTTPAAIEQRWKLINSEAKEALLDGGAAESASGYERNIEQYIGTVKVPVGLAGPLRVNGLFARGDYYLPLATTEAALVASYSRGALALTEAGGCSAMLLSEGVSRAPGFAFANLREAGTFAAWAAEQFEAFAKAASATTRHGKMIDMRITVEGNHVYLIFEYHTGDASGQNMVTIATAAVCAYILEKTPVKPRYHFIEANMSGDKKASAQSFLTVRGKKVTAEAMLPAELVEKRLHSTPLQMARYWSMSAMGGVLSGSVGIQGHYANGLAALYLACGQDVACVAESATGVTRMELTDEGDLYASVTLPNLMVGTVGGGTGLPSQRACLKILGLHGEGKARTLAEVCAGMALAGELSIIGALAAGHFARAHERLARGRNKKAGK